VKVTFEIDSGVFILTQGLAPTIHLGSGNELIKLVLLFRSDPSGKSLVRADPVDNLTLRLAFENWDNVLGTAFVDPIEIGTLHGRKLSINFVVRRIGNEGETREIAFSAYLAEEVRLGAN
jgi:hypothetical protein